VVIAIVAQALLKLGRTAVKRSPLLVLTGTTVLALYLVGVNELALLFGAGLGVLLARRTARLRPGPTGSIIALVAAGFLPVAEVAEPPRSSWDGCFSSS
jgi:chromate transport protein ChrA